jgi:RNA polymerase sigma-32 factor
VINAFDGPGGGRARPGTSSSVPPAYLLEIRQFPLLSRDEEHALAVEYRRTEDSRLADRLVTSNLRLVVKIAREYCRSARDLPDLIQEGNMGLVRAVRRFDPERGVRLGSYASWWIRAYILRVLLINSRLVKLGTTQSQRRLFFNLSKERDGLEKLGIEATSERLAGALGVPVTLVVEMTQRLRSEASLDAPANPNGSEPSLGNLVCIPGHQHPDNQVESSEFGSLLRNKLETFALTLGGTDADIFRERILSDEPVPLVQIAGRYSVSRQRICHREARIRTRLREYLREQLGDSLGQFAEELPADDTAEDSATAA